MNTVLQSLLPFLAIIVVLIVMHELGHFVAAKLLGVRVLEFGLGFPPRLWGVRRGETEYTLNAIPLGGFVRMLGEEDPSDPHSLAARPRWARFIVLSAGSIMNAVLAVLLFSLALMIPREVSIGRALIAEVAPNSPAERAGLQAGDVIYAINGREVKNTLDAGYIIRLNLGEDVDVTVKRDREFITLRPHARWAPPEGEGPTGILITPQYPFTETQVEAPWEAIPQGVQKTYEALILARNEVISWFKGAAAPQVSGPVGIAQATGEVVEEAGWKSLMDFAALLSVNLAILNILPLPMLDGGRLVFVLLEVARRGRRVAPQKEALVHFVGLVALLTLAVVITYFDVLRIFSGESILR